MRGSPRRAHLSNSDGFAFSINVRGANGNLLMDSDCICDPFLARGHFDVPVAKKTTV